MRRQLLDEVFHALLAVKKQEGIRHLADLTPDGKHSLTFYSEITGSRQSIEPSSIFLWDDFSSISSDLVHFTEWMFALRPHINDATVEDGTYFQNRFDAKYLSYASILAGFVYNFWDRIGDLLYCYFRTGLQPGSVYVGRVLNNLGGEARQSSHFLRLVEIYDTSVKDLIQDRNADAHSQSMASRRYYDTILARGKSQADQVAAKYGLPELFKQQIELAHEAFELALRMIEDECVMKAA